ncbi:MAG: hypothetical protein K0U38_08875 [Epsilonproteobacteria bacterium]|nr:hypothetical protein [Campylobacterota bacterium]
MIKKIVLLLLLSTAIFAEPLKEHEKDNIYTRNCIPCHEYLPSTLERLFMSYLKVYSGEFTFKETLKAFLRKPDVEMSAMSDIFLDRFSVKDKSDLSDEEIEEAVNIYWEMYNVRNKLR